MFVAAENPAVLPFTDRLEKQLARWTGPIAFAGVVGMLAIAGVTVLDVILRWTINKPITGLNEIVAMLFAVAVAACIPAGISNGVNLKVDLLSRCFSDPVRAGLDVLGNAMLALFFGLLTWHIAAHSYTLIVQYRVSPILSWPQGPFIAAVAVLLAVASFIQCVITINTLKRAIFNREAGEYPTRSAIWITLGIGFLVVAIAAYGLINFDLARSLAKGNIGWMVIAAFAAMWILMLALIPLAAVMGLTGVVGAALFIGWTPTLNAFATESTGFLTNSQVATLPLFLMMGSFAAVADLSSDLYRLAHVLLSRFRGGLALATIGGCAGFGALTGSSLATAATIGRVALPEMEARGYSPALSTGCCAAGGTLGAIVPPGSGPLIVFALLTEASIGRLFIASVGPAVLAILLYLLTVFIYVRVAPESAPATSGHETGELKIALGRCKAVGLLFLVVMGGLYFGFFTDTESAAVGAIGAFLIALWRGKLRSDSFFEVVGETTATTALIYGLIFGAMIFSFFVGTSGLTEAFTESMRSLNWSPLWLMALILLVYLLLGSIMESFAVMVITVPIVTPLILDMGYDLIWWGVIMLCVVETGLIHPPLGLNVFVLKSLLPKVPLWTIYKGVMPFVLADLVKLVLLVLFPGICLWLVDTMVN